MLVVSVIGDGTSLTNMYVRVCSCPGVFSGQGCGAELKWVQFREGKGCWGCSSWPACDYKEAALERLATPQVTLEAVNKELFKVLVPCLSLPPCLAAAAKQCNMCIACHCHQV